MGCVESWRPIETHEDFEMITLVLDDGSAPQTEHINLNNPNMN